MKLAPAALSALLVAGGFALPAAPAAAQNQRIIEIFGNDPCPSSQGEEIVVCRRLPEEDRFRIPETLRRSEPDAAANNSGMALAESTDAASRPNAGIDTCTPVGAGGHTGCNRTMRRQARAERAQQEAEAPVIDE